MTTTTEGMVITEENVKKLMSDLSRGKPIKGGIDLDGVFYEDFIHFTSYLINKYFTKEHQIGTQKHKKGS